MATESEKRRGDRSRDIHRAEELAQWRELNEEEVALRNDLEWLSWKSRLSKAMHWEWPLGLVGLAGLYFWWTGGPRWIEEMAAETGVPETALWIAGGLVTLAAAGSLDDWRKGVSARLAEDCFDFLEKVRGAAVDHLKSREATRDRIRHGVRLFRLLAEHGDALAQIQTGILHAEQIGTVHDPGEAVRWFRRAAELKHAGAMHRLGDCYVRGLGVKRDYSEAIRWYWKATTEGWHSRSKWTVVDIPGFPPSLWNLGYMYAKGMGVKKNLPEARRHYSNAATSYCDVEDYFAFESEWEIGPHREAYREIGKACRLVGLDEEAAVWLGWAADEGDDEARRECSDLVNHGAAWLRKAAETGIDEDDNRRYEYAERGEPDAQVRLGHLYVQGRGVPRDLAAGEDWYRTGIENHRRLQFDFSPALRDAPDNVEEAVKWLRAKAEAEAPDSTSWWRWKDARAALRRLRRRRRPHRLDGRGHQRGACLWGVVGSYGLLYAFLFGVPWTGIVHWLQMTHPAVQEPVLFWGGILGLCALWILLRVAWAATSDCWNSFRHQRSNDLHTR